MSGSTVHKELIAGEFADLITEFSVAHRPMAYGDLRGRGRGAGRRAG
ncbi:hypothetical protein [Amycolatopsis pretoriensis]|nr:hypothetical protein [Amycolatopsis pretoriensis]